MNLVKPNSSWWEVHFKQDNYSYWCFNRYASSLEEALEAKKDLEKNEFFLNCKIRILKITAEEVV